MKVFERHRHLTLSTECVLLPNCDADCGLVCGASSTSSGRFGRDRRPSRSSSQHNRLLCHSSLDTGEKLLPTFRKTACYSPHFFARLHSLHFAGSMFSKDQECQSLWIRFNMSLLCFVIIFLSHLKQEMMEQVERERKEHEGVILLQRTKMLLDMNTKDFGLCEQVMLPVAFSTH